MIKCSSISPALQFCVNSLWPDSRQKRPWTPAIVVMFLFCYRLVSDPLYPYPTQWLSQSRGVHVSLIPSQWLIRRGHWKFGAETSGSQFLGFQYRHSHLVSLIQCFSTGGHLGCHTGTSDREEPGTLQNTPQGTGTCSKDSFCPKRQRAEGRFCF